VVVSGMIFLKTIEIWDKDGLANMRNNDSVDGRSR